MSIEPKQISSAAASVGDVLTKSESGAVWQAPTLISFPSTDIILREEFLILPTSKQWAFLTGIISGTGSISRQTTEFDPAIGHIALNGGASGIASVQTDLDIFSPSARFGTLVISAKANVYILNLGANSFRFGFFDEYNGDPIVGFVTRNISGTDYFCFRYFDGLAYQEVQTGYSPTDVYQTFHLFVVINGTQVGFSINNDPTLLYDWDSNLVSCLGLSLQLLDSVAYVDFLELQYPNSIP